MNRACLTRVIGQSEFASGYTVFDSSADVEMEDPVIEADLAINQWDTPFACPGVVPVLPPGEDVRVGDMVVYPFNLDSHALANSRTRRGGGVLNQTSIKD